MILITGATGFIGDGVYRSLYGRNSLRLAVRSVAERAWPDDVDIVNATLSHDHDWSCALAGVTAIVHCAARVHVMKDGCADPLSEFRKVNVEGTLNLARQAARAGVRRFVYISSIKVNGEITAPGHPFVAGDMCFPQDPYGISKMEAELGLLELSSQTAMQMVVIRPPLVYGLGVKANFATMLRWVRLGIPLPFGKATNNLRSLVYIGNLVDLICVCLDHPKAINQIFLVSDGEDVSTALLLQKMSKALGNSSRLLNVNSVFIKLAMRLIGYATLADRLYGSLQVDITKTKSLLNWQPKFSLDEGLARTVSNSITKSNK